MSLSKLLSLEVGGGSLSKHIRPFLASFRLYRQQSKADDTLCVQLLRMRLGDLDATRATFEAYDAGETTITAASLMDAEEPVNAATVFLLRGSDAARLCTCALATRRSTNM